MDAKERSDNTDIIRTVTNVHIGPTGMDMHECISLSYADGKMANLQSGALCLNDRQGIISGVDGYIRVDNVNCPELVEVYRNYELVATYKKPADMVTGYEYQVFGCKWLNSVMVIYYGSSIIIS